MMRSTFFSAHLQTRGVAVQQPHSRPCVIRRRSTLLVQGRSHLEAVHLGALAAAVASHRHLDSACLVAGASMAHSLFNACLFSQGPPSHLAA